MQWYSDLLRWKFVLEVEAARRFHGVERGISEANDSRSKVIKRIRIEQPGILFMPRASESAVVIISQCIVEVGKLKECEPFFTTKGPLLVDVFVPVEKVTKLIHREVMKLGHEAAVVQGSVKSKIELGEMVEKDW